ncbi:MAG: NAD-dependent epimerase/dehydratase family protein [Patescibacteria group bacterium]|nr:NAD-dependent epimerase/dehydratase family protein [Patescibacteria group bacterium]
MSKILVTGGAGFIGSTLVDALLANGHAVTVLDNLVSGRRDYINQAADFWELDILDESLTERFLESKFDFVYHLAAQIDVRISVEDPVFDNRINVLGGLNILEASRKSGVKKVIMASTGGAIYGDTDIIPTPETAPTYPLSPYGINKLTLEKHLNYYYQVYGLNYSVLRFSNVYGPRQYKGGEAGVIAIFTEALANNKSCLIYGDGKQTRDYVYVDDVVSALIKAMTVEAQQEINISTANEVDIWEMISMIEKAAQKKLEVKLAPTRAGEQKRSCLSNSRAQEILGWQPQINFTEGIARTYKWVAEQVK